MMNNNTVLVGDTRKYRVCVCVGGGGDVNQWL